MAWNSPRIRPHGGCSQVHIFTSKYRIYHLPPTSSVTTTPPTGVSHAPSPSNPAPAFNVRPCLPGESCSRTLPGPAPSLFDYDLDFPHPSAPLQKVKAKEKEKGKARAKAKAKEKIPHQRSDPLTLLAKVRVRALEDKITRIILCPPTFTLSTSGGPFRAVCSGGYSLSPTQLSTSSFRAPDHPFRAVSSADSFLLPIHHPPSPLSTTQRRPFRAVWSGHRSSLPQPSILNYIAPSRPFRAVWSSETPDQIHLPAPFDSPLLWAVHLAPSEVRLAHTL